MRAEILEEVKKEIEKMLAAGFIRPCRYAEWISSIVPVEKKDGRWRVAIDFRDLNRATPKDEYPMPVAETLIKLLATRRMLDAETRYPEVEKLCLCLFFTCTKLHHILLTAEIIVICKSDVVKHMLSAPVLKGRLDYFTKWVEAVPMKKVKSEDVIKFVKEHVIHRFGMMTHKYRGCIVVFSISKNVDPNEEQGVDKQFR
ncbi:hypothetical protein QYE76_056572 [Lolium multiflorum]|uniref:Reverse transcriptase RNase H-like domain-containing protein n=1 Tax=Lolium multiflorum TaxID=4521 RepID=A0AAD8T1Y0_LOLMU|nr:hypothetical protein QYE76_056572 [Lolium multiflorum]